METAVAETTADVEETTETVLEAHVRGAATDAVILQTEILIEGRIPTTLRQSRSI